METKQFCHLKTPEEAQNEMESFTKKEMEKLTRILKEKPHLLNKHDSDSSDSDSLSVSSSDSDEKILSYKLMKKEKELDKMEERKHFATLEINNLLLENIDLKKELEELRIQNNVINNLVHTISKIHDIKVLDNFDDYRLDENSSFSYVTEVIINLQKKYLDINDQISVLKMELVNNFKDEKYKKIKTFYDAEITNFESCIKEKYENKRKDLERYIFRINKKNKFVETLIVSSFIIMFMALFISKFIL